MNFEETQGGCVERGVASFLEGIKDTALTIASSGQLPDGEIPVVWRTHRTLTSMT